ncbi:MAG: hypothetical protein DRJ40_11450 [Thermoprotei archaeon]|nr:MAG: hypothetical protein DRJ40_11450 [Thermoprotei archaeon]
MDLICPRGRELGCVVCTIYKSLQAYVRGYITYNELARRIRLSELPSEWKEKLLRYPLPQTFEDLVLGREYSVIRVRGHEVEITLPCYIAVDGIAEVSEVAREVGAVPELRGTADKVDETQQIRVTTTGRLLVKLGDRRVRGGTVVLLSRSLLSKLCYALACAENIPVRTVGFMFGRVDTSEVLGLGRVLDILIAESEFIDPATRVEELKERVPNIWALFTRFREKGGDLGKVLEVLNLGEDDLRELQYNCDYAEWFNPFKRVEVVSAGRVFWYRRPEHVLASVTGLEPKLIQQVLRVLGAEGVPKIKSWLYWFTDEGYSKLWKVVSILRSRYPDLARELRNVDSPVSKLLKYLKAYEIVKSLVLGTVEHLELDLSPKFGVPSEVARELDYERDVLDVEEGVYFNLVELEPDRPEGFVAVVTRDVVVWGRVNKYVRRVIARCLICGYESIDSPACRHVKELYEKLENLAQPTRDNLERLARELSLPLRECSNPIELATKLFTEVPRRSRVPFI